MCGDLSQLVPNESGLYKWQDSSRLNLCQEMMAVVGTNEFFILHSGQEGYFWSVVLAMYYAISAWDMRFRPTQYAVQLLSQSRQFSLSFQLEIWTLARDYEPVAFRAVVTDELKRFALEDIQNRVDEAVADINTWDRSEDDYLDEEEYDGFTSWKSKVEVASRLVESAAELGLQPESRSVEQLRKALGIERYAFEPDSDDDRPRQGWSNFAWTPQSILEDL